MNRLLLCVYAYIVDYYLAIKNEILLSAIIQLVNLEGIMVSEKCQRKTNTI